MTHRAALWMDHNEARVVALDGDSNAHHLVAHLHAHDLHTHPKKEAGDRHPPDSRFLHAVKASIADCEHVALFGPGQARHDLVAALQAERSPVLSHIVAVLPLDRVTDAQLAVHGREVLDERERMSGVHVLRTPTPR